MIRSIATSLIFVLCIRTCAQEVRIKEPSAPIKWIPLLDSDKQFVYVDSLRNIQLQQRFDWAQPFTPTGYAIVGNKHDQQALIDSKGTLVVQYSDAGIELLPLGQVTLMMKRREYEKNLPIWKWNMNIMGGGIVKTATYVNTEIRVLESGQVLLKKDIPLDEGAYGLDAYSIDSNHFVLNGSLYRIKNRQLKKINSSIGMALDNGRYIPEGRGNFAVYDVKSSKPILSGLMGTYKIDLLWGNQTLQLDSVNQERYEPAIPKLLKNISTGDIYTFPQYDKVFPKRIGKATAKQIAFLKEASLVYSVTNSPYFILGKFNYDHNVWAYEWLYMDKDGNLMDKITAKDFFILDQVGYLVWPDRHMLFPAGSLQKDWKLGKIKYIKEGLYRVDVKRGENDPTEGIWNSESNLWDIAPEVNHIQILDGQRQIFAVQKEKEGLYTLYDNVARRRIGTKSYYAIGSEGFVQVKKDGSKNDSYYIDIYTGNEYKK